MKTVNMIVDNMLRVVMATSSAVLFVVTVLQVLFRFILKSPLAWSQDVIRFCFVYVVFCGATWCVREKAHLNIDVVLTAIKPKARVFVELVINLVLLAFFVFLLYYGVQFAQSGITQTASYLPIKMTYYYISVPICAFIMFYYLIQQVAEQILILLGKSKLEGGEGK